MLEIEKEVPKFDKINALQKAGIHTRIIKGAEATCVKIAQFQSFLKFLTQVKMF